MINHSKSPRLALVYCEYENASSFHWTDSPGTPHETIALFGAGKKSSKAIYSRKHGLLLEIDAYVKDQRGVSRQVVIVIINPGGNKDEWAAEITRQVAAILTEHDLEVSVSGLADFIRSSDRKTHWINRANAKSSPLKLTMAGSDIMAAETRAPGKVIILLGHFEWTKIRDSQPELLRRENTTLVPWPLMGSWTQFSELRELEDRATEGDILFLDETSGERRYVRAADVIANSTKMQADRLYEVCSLLGARKLVVKDHQLQSEKQSMGGSATASHRFGLSLPAFLTRNTGASENKSLSVTFEGTIDTAVGRSTRIDTGWSAKEPDFAAALSVVGDHDDAIDDIIRLFIRERERGIEFYRCEVDFLRDSRRRLTVAAELTHSIEGSIEGADVTDEARANGKFDIDQRYSSRWHHSIYVSFIENAPSVTG